MCGLRLWPDDSAATPWNFRAHVQKPTKNRRRWASARTKARVVAREQSWIEKGIFMDTGTVKFYNEQKGFGFIAPDNGGKDVFVHATALERAGMHSLSEGQKVSYDTEEDRRSGKTAVANIQAA